MPGYVALLVAIAAQRHRVPDPVVGGPEGFEDVVASINPISDDQPDTPPQWSVTFGVDDADAISAKATELGGNVIAAPFDAPWVRMAVISDPQGATFIASKFVEENKDLSSRRKPGPGPRSPTGEMPGLRVGRLP